MINYFNNDPKLQALSECGILSDSDINEVFFRVQWRRIAKKLKYNQIKNIILETPIFSNPYVYGNKVLQSIKTDVLYEMDINRDIMQYDCFACYQVYENFNNCTNCCIDWGIDKSLIWRRKTNRLCLNKHTLYYKMIKLCNKYGKKINKGKNPYFLRKKMSKTALAISNMSWYGNKDVVKWKDI